MPNPTSFQTIIPHLAAISGSEHCSSDRSSLVVAPESTDEVSKILSFANEARIMVNPVGGGTKQAWGSVSNALLLLKTRRLNKVQEHAWQDMTCTVAAGCTWAAMQDVLGQHGQFVALDPLWPDKATIGGIAATNDSGSLRLKYGSLRDLVIGMTVVLADGTIARSGGKVVKNVAGYDLHKLMIGAFGTLGILTEITFRLHSIPLHTQTLTYGCENPEPLGQFLMKVLDSQFSSQALQLRSDKKQFYVDLQLSSFPEVISEQTGSLALIAAALGLSETGAERSVWRARQELFGQQESIVIKATVFPDQIASLALAIHGLGGVSVTQASGIMTANIPAVASPSLLTLRQRVELSGGSLTILESSPAVDEDPWGSPGDSFALMREIKQRFDRNRILNPSRFIGGI